MNLEALSIFPQAFAAITDFGVTRRALELGLCRLRCWSPRDYANNRHQSVDDRPFGGGPGMVMQAGPLDACLDAVQAAHAAEGLAPAPVVYCSPQGEVLNEALVQTLLAEPTLIVVAGRYEGVDERFLATRVHREISIGDYVLTGGELPAMVLMDALIRRVPGVLGDELSAAEDSFATGLLDCAHYTRPAVYRGMPVPDVLMSGDHAAIRRWRLQQALGRTWLRRPDLLQARRLTREEAGLLQAFQAEHTALAAAQKEQAQPTSRNEAAFDQELDA